VIISQKRSKIDWHIWNIEVGIVCTTEVGVGNLRPVSFIFYTTDLISLTERHSLSPHLCADDIQVYGSCRPATLSLSMIECTADVASWTKSCKQVWAERQQKRDHLARWSTYKPTPTPIPIRHTWSMECWLPGVLFSWPAILGQHWPVNVDACRENNILMLCSAPSAPQGPSLCQRLPSRRWWSGGLRQPFLTNLFA